MITINGSVPVSTMYGPRKRLAWWEWPIAVVVLVGVAIWEAM